MVSNEQFENLVAWAQRELTHPQPRRAQKVEEFKAAMTAFDAALTATVKYLDRLAGRSRPSKAQEDNLSKLWRDASIAVRPFDRNLSDRCFMKGQGWLDPRLWRDPEFATLRLSIKDMRDGLRQLNQTEIPEEVPDWFPKAGLAFAAATFTSLLFLMIVPDLTPAKRIIFDGWLAFCLAASGTFIGGSAVATGKLSLPFFKKSPISFSAFGGVAIFIVVFLLLSAVHRYQ